MWRTVISGGYALNASRRYAKVAFEGVCKCADLLAVRKSCGAGCAKIARSVVVGVEGPEAPAEPVPQGPLGDPQEPARCTYVALGDPERSADQGDLEAEQAGA